MHTTRWHVGRSLALLAAAVALVATACSSTSSVGQLVRTGRTVEGEAVSTGLTRFETSHRPDLPDVRGKTLEGTTLALRDLRGHPVVVNVWGSWCGPCRAEAPDLARVARETHERGVRFVGIDVRDDDAAARAFVQRFGIPYPSLVDRKGRLLVSLRNVVPQNAIPSTLVIDPDGKVAARIIGRVNPAILRRVLGDNLTVGRRPASAVAETGLDDRKRRTG